MVKSKSLILGSTQNFNLIPCKKEGLTLVELILALTISVIMIGIVGVSLRGVVN